MSDNSRRDAHWAAICSGTAWGPFSILPASNLPTILVVRMATGLNASGVFNYAMNTTNAFLTIAIYGMRAYQVSDLEGRYTDREYLSSRWLTSLVAAAACGCYGAVIRWTGRTGRR